MTSPVEAGLRGFVAQSKAQQDEHFRSIQRLQVLAAEARQLEWRVADRVNAAYGLTPAEVALMIGPRHVATGPPLR